MTTNHRVTMDTDQKIKILVIDDDKDSHLLMKYMLDNSNLDYEALNVMSIVEAIDIIEAKIPIDIAIVDYQLRPGTAFDFFRYLKEKNITLPCILTSAYEDDSLEIKAIDSGFAGQLNKDDINQRTIKRTVLYALKNQREKNHLEFASTRDAETGLASRSLFMDRLSQACRAIPDDYLVGVLCIHIDSLDLIKKTYGNIAGQSILKTSANRIQTAIGSRNTAARIANDEFAIMLPQTTVVDANQIKRRVMSTLREPFEIDHQKILVHPNAGSALARPGEASSVQLMHNAITSLNRAIDGKPDNSVT